MPRGRKRKRKENKRTGWPVLFLLVDSPALVLSGGIASPKKKKERNSVTEGFNELADGESVVIDKAPDPDHEVGYDDECGINQIGEGEDKSDELVVNEEEDESTDDDKKIEELCYAGNDCVGGVVPEVQGIGTDNNQN